MAQSHFFSAQLAVQPRSLLRNIGIPSTFGPAKLHHGTLSACFVYSRSSRECLSSFTPYIHSWYFWPLLPYASNKTVSSSTHSLRRHQHRGPWVLRVFTHPCYCHSLHTIACFSAIRVLDCHLHSIIIYFVYIIHPVRTFQHKHLSHLCARSHPPSSIHGGVTDPLMDISTASVIVCRRHHVFTKSTTKHATESMLTFVR